MAAIWGDADTGAHGTFSKFAPGYDAGMHTHTNDVSIVVSRAPICTRMLPARSVWGQAASCEFPVDGSIGAGAIPKRERSSMKNRPASST